MTLSKTQKVCLACVRASAGLINFSAMCQLLNTHLTVYVFANT